MPHRLVDRIYFAWFVALSAAVLLLHARVPGWPRYLLLHLLLALAIVALVWGSRRSLVAAFLHDWYPQLIFLVCFTEVARLSQLFLPGWRDAALLTFESRIFAVPPTVWFGEHSSYGLTELMSLGYLSYYPFLMIVGGAMYARIQQDPLPFRRVMAASVLAYMICYVAFLIFPTEGPMHTLALLHTRPLPGGVLYETVLFLQKGGGVHGNAFPSAHVAGAVAALGIAWLHRPRLALALTPFTLLLCLGAVYARYHYVSDVVAGILVGALAAIVTCDLPKRLLSENWKPGTEN